MLLSSSEDFAIIVIICFSIIPILMFTRWDVELSRMCIIFVIVCVLLRVLHCWTEQIRLDGQHSDGKQEQHNSCSTN